jgi:hypothetical protein
MNTEAANYQSGDVLDLLADTTYAAGQMIQIAGKAGMVQQDLVSGQTGSVVIKGEQKVRAAAVAGNAGDNVWWDEDATGVDGNSGACTTNAADGDFWCGTLAAVLSAASGEAKVLLNEVTPALPAWVNRTHVKKTADYTVLGTDNGKVIHCDGSAEVDDIIILTMTAIATIADGFSVVIVNDAADGASQLQIELAAADKFLNPTALDDGDQLHNTLATSKRGDYVVLRASADGFYVEEMRGTWADGGA